MPRGLKRVVIKVVKRLNLYGRRSSAWHKLIGVGVNIKVRQYFVK